MNLCKHLMTASAIAMGTWLPTTSFAQPEHSHDHTPAAPSTALTEGEVTKVNRETSKITIKHGEIKYLEMPAMTMAFTIKDKRLLNAVKPGDKVQFGVTKEGGKLVVTDIQPQR